MKLAHYEFDTVFNLQPCTVNVLVIEDENKFWQYCSELHAQINGEEGRFCLSEGDDIIPFKSCAFINDYFAVNLGDKKYTTKLYQHLQTITDDNHADCFNKIRAEVVALLEMLNSESDCAIDYDEEVGILGVLKAFGVSLAINAQALVEQLLNVMQVMSKFASIKTFFFVNLKTMLSERDLLALYRSAELDGIQLFLLESTQRPKLPTETMVIIDRDLCEIVVSKE